MAVFRACLFVAVLLSCWFVARLLPGDGVVMAGPVQPVAAHHGAATPAQRDI